MNQQLINLFKEYAVSDCKDVEEFTKKYYKDDRLFGRGEEYGNLIINSNKEDLEKDGVVIITHHSSVTGRTVSFLKK